MSINSKISEVRDMFMLLDNPMDKYTQIIELGKKNEGMPNKENNNQLNDVKNRRKKEEQKERQHKKENKQQNTKIIFF